MLDQTDHDQENDQKKDGAGEQQTEILQTPVERSLLGTRGEPAGDVAESGLGAGGHHQGARGSADDGGTQENHILRVGLGGDFPAKRLFFDWQRLARQHGLLNIEIAGFQEARICRDQVSGRQPYNIAGDNIGAPGFLPLPVAQHGRGGCDLLPQLFDRALRLVILREVERGAEQDDDGDDRRVRRFTEKGGNEGGDQQYQYQWI